MVDWLLPLFLYFCSFKKQQNNKNNRNATSTFTSGVVRVWNPSLHMTPVLTPVDADPLCYFWRLALCVDRWKLFRLLRSMLTFRGLSVCHVRALCSNGRRYRHDFFYIRQPHFSTRSLTSLNPLITKFCSKITHPCWFERRRHSMAKIAAK